MRWCFRLHADELRKHFTKAYPQCSRRQIESLVSAILSNKYWRVHSQRSDAYYTVALTRALIPCEGGFRAKSTASGAVIVSPRAARFCRRGRILVVKKRSDGHAFISETVIDWPTFLKVIKLNEDSVYKCLVESSSPPAFLNRRSFAKLMKDLEVK